MGEILWGKTPWGETLWGRTPWGKTSERGPPLKGGPSLRTSLPRELSPQPPAFQSVRIRNRRTAGRLRGNSHPGERHMTKRQTAKLRFPARHGKAKAEKPKNRKNVQATPRRRKTEPDHRYTLINTKIRPAPNGAVPRHRLLARWFSTPVCKNRSLCWESSRRWEARREGALFQEVPSLRGLFHPPGQMASWKVREMTSSCCSRESLWKLTA